MTDLSILFRSNGGDDDDDALTIQATNANSHLGTLLLESDWGECISYLQTPDGQRDVIDGMDPLGLLHQQEVSNLNNDGTGEGTVLFAALYVRAPYDIVQMIHDIILTQTTQPASDRLHISNYLVYVLYVVPSEEASRLVSNNSSPAAAMLPYYQQTRAWSMDEYEKIINLLLRSMSSSSSSSTLLTCYQRTTCCGGVGNNTTKGERTCLTPLALACYNYNVPPSIVVVLCTLQPCAMDIECTFFTNDNNDEELFVKTLPLFLAAASPLPTNKLSSSEYKEMQERRWNKVKLLTLGMDWYYSNKQNIDNETSLYTTAAAPGPTVEQVKHVCEIAIQYKEWELVREYMNHYPALLTEMVVLLSSNDNNVSTTTIADALAQHDNHYTETLQHHKRKQEKQRKRREWLHRNMGPVMYEIDAFLNVVRAVMIPTIWKKNSRRGGKTGRGIVLPMS